MSSQTPPTGTPAAVPAATGAPAATPAPAPAPAAPKVSAANKVFRVRAGHDWGHFDAGTKGEAEMAFRNHFGIRGSKHEFEVTVVSAKPEKGYCFSYDKPPVAAKTE